MKKFVSAVALITAMICLPNEYIVGDTLHKPVENEESVVDVVVAEEPLPIIEEVKNEGVEANTISLGVCKLTAYCKENYPHICNNGDANATSTGAVPTVGRTVAVDPSVIPYGSEVIINGHTYVAEDCGGAIKGNTVDILFATHQEALDFGVQYAEVFLVK
jgi:3D (Asp-Asp-Asp) domain-containing protein